MGRSHFRIASPSSPCRLVEEPIWRRRRISSAIAQSQPNINTDTDVPAKGREITRIIEKATSADLEVYCVVNLRGLCVSWNHKYVGGLAIRVDDHLPGSKEEILAATSFLLSRDGALRRWISMQGAEMM